MAHWLSPSTLALLSSRDCSSADQPKQAALSTYHAYPHLTLIPCDYGVAILIGINPREYLGTISIERFPTFLLALAKDSLAEHLACKNRLTFAPESLIITIPDLHITL
jgi:hypothetical protein